MIFLGRPDHRFNQLHAVLTLFDLKIVVGIFLDSPVELLDEFAVAGPVVKLRAIEFFVLGQKRHALIIDLVEPIAIDNQPSLFKTDLDFHAGVFPVGVGGKKGTLDPIFKGQDGRDRVFHHQQTALPHRRVGEDPWDEWFG